MPSAAPVSDGHTPGLLLTRLATDRGSAVFCGDLIPGLPWVHLPVTMGYDRYPELLIDEKTALLERCRADGTQLLFTHDPRAPAARVTRDEKGRYKPLEPQETRGRPAAVVGRAYQSGSGRVSLGGTEPH